MTFLSDKILGNFRPPKNPNRKREPKARDKRSGMDPKHLANIRKLPSCISGMRPCEAHHLRVKNERGIGLKATDKWAVPLTPEEHREVHRVGSRKEEDWFAVRGIDTCYALATALWFSRGNLEAMERVIEAHRTIARTPD